MLVMLPCRTANLQQVLRRLSAQFALFARAVLGFRRPLLLTSVAMACVLAACKAVNLEPWPGSLTTVLSDLLVAAHRDLLVVTISAVIAYFALLSASRWPRLERIVWSAWVVYCVTVAAYAVVACRAYSILWVPLTWRLVAIGGSPSELWSSTRDALTPGFLIALVGAPLLIGLLARRRMPVSRRFRIVTSVAGALAVALSLLIVQAGQLRFEQSWQVRNDRAVAVSPHIAFVLSFLQASGGSWERPPRSLNETFGEQEMNDFRRPFASPAPVTTATPRGVILYVIESAGAEYLDLYGGKWGISPRLDAFAERSVVFDNAYANLGKSEGAMASLQLSTYLPLTWEMFTVAYPRAQGMTLASLLHQRGFRTALLSAAHLDFASQREFLRDRGYDSIVDGERLGCEPISQWGVSDACLVDAILRTLDDHNDQPFFIFAWTTQTHHPYPQPGGLPPPKFAHPPLPKQPFSFDAYLGAMAEADLQFGRLVEGLRRRGIEDDVLVAVIGDHAESFGQRHLAMIHGLHLYEEEVRVPFMVHWPRGLPGPRRDQTVCSHVDVTPTLAHLAGVGQDPSWFGRSVFDPTHPNRAYLFASSSDLIVGLRDPSWKYVVDLADGHDELYDFRVDRDEQRNLAGVQPLATRGLRRRLAAWVSMDQALWNLTALPPQLRKAEPAPAPSP